MTRSRPKGQLARDSEQHVLRGATVFHTFDIGRHDVGDPQVSAVWNGVRQTGRPSCEREKVDHVTRVEDR